MIDDRHAERLDAPRNGLADPSHAHHADGAVAQRVGQRIIARRPFAGAQIALRLRQFAHRREQQPERGVGDLFVEDARRVGHGDAVRARPFRIDVVVADAEGRDEFQLREPLHQVGADLVRGQRHRDGAHLVRDGIEERILVLRVLQRVQVHRVCQAAEDDRLLGSHQQDVWLLAGHRKSP